VISHDAEWHAVEAQKITHNLSLLFLRLVEILQCFYFFDPLNERERCDAPRSTVRSVPHPSHPEPRSATKTVMRPVERDLQIRRRSVQSGPPALITSSFKSTTVVKCPERGMHYSVSASEGNLVKKEYICIYKKI
jgi:hypothetical protein